MTAGCGRVTVERGCRATANVTGHVGIARDWNARRQSPERSCESRYWLHSRPD
jgi:hypothetical protein